MHLIDTHCHWNHERLRNEMSSGINRAQEAGVSQMIVVGYDQASSEEAVAISSAHRGYLFAAVGIHPHEAKLWNDASALWLREIASSPSVVAIGEIGLDFHYDFSPVESQYSALEAQMSVANEVGLPVIIHCREAYPECLAALKASGVGEYGGVMHCWAGTWAQAVQSLELGMYLGIGGVVTYPKAGNVHETAIKCPADHLLLETDAPYLTPVPHRGKLNEPAFLRLVAERVAQLRGISVEELSEITTANAERLLDRKSVV